MTKTSNTRPAELPGFDIAWRRYEEQGFRYGRDALENVEFGYRIARDELAALRSQPTPSEDTPKLQAGVDAWMDACFGEPIKSDMLERADRFIEEALELAQTIPDFNADRARALVDYVFARPVGERKQEVGGARVTLAALCNAAGINEDEAAATELARVWTKVEQIRAKQAAKPTGSALPIATPSGEPVSVKRKIVLAAETAGSATAPGDKVKVEQRPFVREDRYIVLKRNRLTPDQEAAIQDVLDARAGEPQVRAVVVEADWPEYETVWKMIEARVTVESQHLTPADDDVERVARAIFDPGIFVGVRDGNEPLHCWQARAVIAALGSTRAVEDMRERAAKVTEDYDTFDRDVKESAAGARVALGIADAIRSLPIDNLLGGESK